MPDSSRKENCSSTRVVFVHGAGAGGWEWNIWTRVFAARGLRTQAPDLMPVEGGLAATTFDDYLAQVLAWCRFDVGQAADRCVLVGASLGGLLALAAAARVKASALLLINPLPAEGINDAHRLAYPPVIPWRSDRSISGTCRAMPDADDAARLFAFHRWRDESGLALGQARRGIAIDLPDCPILLMASENDEDVAAATSREFAAGCSADFICLSDSSHVGPVLGRQAASAAEQALSWLASHRLTNLRNGFGAE